MSELQNLYAGVSDYNNTVPDRFGRSRIYNSRNTDIFSPTVSKKIFEAGLRPHYPGKKQFAVCISHDVDHLFVTESFSRKLLNTSKRFLKGDLRMGGHYLKTFIDKDIYPPYNLKRLIALNDKNGIKSSFYFLSLASGEEDYNYDVDQIADQFDLVRRGKNEIGLHGGHEAYRDLAKLTEEKNRLEKVLGMKVKGYRNHYLRFELPTTWNHLAEAGFEYDTTFSYADSVGFRNGMCYPFLPFDFSMNRFVDIVELPLIVMDATLFHYMRLDPKVALTICRRLCADVKRYHGVFTLLIHNHFLQGEMGEFYRDLINTLKEEDPWFATSTDVVKWWRDERLLQQSQQIISDLIK